MNRSRTPSPTRIYSRARIRSEERSPPGKRSRSRTPEPKGRTTFTIIYPDTQFEEEEEYLHQADPGDYLEYNGPAQEDSWRKICKIEDGTKKWVLTTSQEAFGKKRRKRRPTKRRLSKRTRPTKRRPTKRRRHTKKR